MDIKQRVKLRGKGRELWDKGEKLITEGVKLKTEGNKLLEEAREPNILIDGNYHNQNTPSKGTLTFTATYTIKTYREGCGCIRNEILTPSGRVERILYQHICPKHNNH